MTLLLLLQPALAYHPGEISEQKRRREVGQDGRGESRQRALSGT